MVVAAEVPVEAVAAMPVQPSWPKLEEIAHTLAYEAAVLGPGNPPLAARRPAHGAGERTSRDCQTITSSREVTFSRSPPVSVHTTMSSMRAPCRPGR